MKQGLGERDGRNGRPDVQVSVQRADREPGERADHRENERGPARRRRIHRLQNRADGFAVVVGRGARRERRLGLALVCRRLWGRAGPQQRRRLGRGHARLEDRRGRSRLGRRERRRRRRLRGRSARQDVVVGKVQRAFDRRHRRGDRVRRRILLSHDFPPHLIGVDRLTDRPTRQRFPAGAARKAGGNAPLTTSQSIVAAPI